jgi:hypothetical protein
MSAPVRIDLLPIEIDPRPCEFCGRTIDQHECRDFGEGPEFFCYPDDDLLVRLEMADPRDRWHHSGERPPSESFRNSAPGERASSKPASSKPAPYRLVARDGVASAAEMQRMIDNWGGLHRRRHGPPQSVIDAFDYVARLGDADIWPNGCATASNMRASCWRSRGGLHEA